MIQIRNACKVYHQGIREITALRNVSLSIAKGEFLSIMGPSGSGKSTLLNLIGCLDQPTSGEIFIDGKPFHGISDDELTLVRRRKVGFIFQFFTYGTRTITLKDGSVAEDVRREGLPKTAASTDPADPGQGVV